MKLVAFIQGLEYFLNFLIQTVWVILRAIFEVLIPTRREKYLHLDQDLDAQRKNLLSRSMYFGFWFRLAIIAAIAIPVFFK